MKLKLQRPFPVAKAKHFKVKENGIFFLNEELFVIQWNIALECPLKVKRTLLHIKLSCTDVERFFFKINV